MERDCSAKVRTRESRESNETGHLIPTMIIINDYNTLYYIKHEIAIERFSKNIEDREYERQRQKLER